MAKNYEDLIFEIKEKIEKLENKNIGLDESLKMYEETISLIKMAEKKLKSVEGKVYNIIEKTGEVEEIKL